MAKIKRKNFKNNNRINIKKSRKSFFLMVIFFTIILLLFIVRIFSISIFKSANGHSLNNVASQRYLREQIEIPKRGNIVDRNGNIIVGDEVKYKIVAILDKNQKKDNKPNFVENVEFTADKLSPILGIDKKDIESIINKNENAFQVEFGKKGNELSYDQFKEISDLKLPGIDFITVPSRNYKNPVFASHILGTTILVDDETFGVENIKGKSGIEQSKDNDLSGKIGLKNYSKSSDIAKNESLNGKLVKSSDVKITIDSDLQKTLEDEMDILEKNTNAEEVQATLMDSRTGDILASSQRPTFNLETKEGIENTWNNLLTSTFEPGSTMKTFTLAAAIDKGVFNGKKFFRSGSREVEGGMINDYNRNLGTITFEKGFAASSNVGFSLLEEKIGSKDWKNYLEKFGFLKKVDVGLNDENRGRINFQIPIEQMNTAFGQGITVNPLQLLQGYATIANGGLKVSPKLIKNDSESVDNNKQERVIKKETSDKVIDNMRNVIRDPNGTGPEFDMSDQGIDVAVKTGTAQYVDESGKYTNDYNHSIHSAAVIFPANDPQFVFYIKIKNPRNVDKLGMNKTLADAFKPMATEAMRIYGGEEHKTQIMGNYIGRDKNKSQEELKEKGAEVFVFGTGNKIVDQSKGFNEEIENNEKIFLRTEGEVKAPDLSSWSLFDVRKLSKFLKFKTSFAGYGYVYKQDPKPNDVIKNKKITVYLKEN